MNGVINFLKPPGMSSNGAVVFLRKRLGVKKTGHAGTLDPGACGVLPICVGKATKISSYLMGGDKEYVAEITFGKTTDTGDSDGRVTGQTDNPLPEKEAIVQACGALTGRITQQTPAYSAVKHEGKKLYQLARSGAEVPRKDREVVIHNIDYLAQTRPDAHLIRVSCGKGTYIRTLCEDIGTCLGTLAYMSFLVRTKCAGLDIADAYTADEIDALADNQDAALLPMDMFFGGLLRIDVDMQDRGVLFNGGSVRFDGASEDEVRVYADGTLLGIGRAYDGQLKLSTLLAEG